MRAAIAAAVLLVAGAAVARPARAQATGSAAVEVRAEEDGRPLADATLTVDGAARGVTGADGVLRVDGLAPGRHRAEVTMVGRRPQAFPLSTTAGVVEDLEVRMQPRAIAVEGVQATAVGRARSPLVRGFYQRKEHSVMGSFIDRGEIEKQHGSRFTDLFRRLPGMEIRATSCGYVLFFRRGSATFAGSQICGTQVNGFCAPRYYVDGMPTDLDQNSPDLEISNDEIEGVEVYTGNVPPEFGGSTAQCGVIAIWTRDM